MLRLLSLCSGIAGSELGLVAANLHEKIEPVQFVERDRYCQRILNKWFPSIPIHSDLETFNAKPGQYDLIVAGFPCQPHSLCGEQNGTSDDRNLWPEVYRVVKEAKPIGFILENVPGIRHSNGGQFLKDILQDIATLGFNAEWGSLSVKALGGTHKRERFFLIAYSQSKRWEYQQCAIAAQERTDSTPSTPDNSTVPKWTSTLAQANPLDAGLSEFLVGCLMKNDDLPEALANATIKATAEEVRKPLQAVGNSICPQVCAIVWQRLYEKLIFVS